MVIMVSGSTYFCAFWGTEGNLSELSERKMGSMITRRVSSPPSVSDVQLILELDLDLDQ